MNQTTRRTLGIRAARGYVAAVGAVLIAIALVSAGGYAVQAASGFRLVFSQEEMQAAPYGPAPTFGDLAPPPPGEGPAPPDEGFSGQQYVDLRTMAIPLVLGGFALAAAVATYRPGRRWTVVTLAGALAALLASVYPAFTAIALASYYRMPVADVVPLLAITSLPAIAGAAAGWRIVVERLRITTAVT